MLKKGNLIIIVVFLLIGGAAFMYTPAKSNTPLPLPTTPPPPQGEILPPLPEIEPLTYSTLTLVTETPLRELAEAVGKENLDTVLRINRIDKAHVKTGAVLSVPSDFTYATLSPFPERIESISSVPKMILVSQTVQAFAVYENGTQVKWGATSTGKKSTPTPNGLFNANWKGKEVISTSNDEWILKWNVNIANHLGVSLHQYELPGYPASHSCVRLLEEDAFWIYNWVDQWTLSPDGERVLAKGTPVLLFGQYDYSGTAPWKKLPEDPAATTVDLTEIEDHISRYTGELFPVVETIE